MQWNSFDYFLQNRNSETISKGNSVERIHEAIRKNAKSVSRAKNNKFWAMFGFLPLETPRGKIKFHYQDAFLWRRKARKLSAETADFVETGNFCNLVVCYNKLLSLKLIDCFTFTVRRSGVQRIALLIRRDWQTAINQSNSLNRRNSLISLCLVPGRKNLSIQRGNLWIFNPTSSTGNLILSDWRLFGYVNIIRTLTRAGSHQILLVEEWDVKAEAHVSCLRINPVRVGIRLVPINNFCRFMEKR